MQQKSLFPEIRNVESRTLPAEASRLFAAGAKDLAAGRYDAAYEGLTRAAQIAPEHARIRSVLGLSVAYVERDLERARTLCESATQQEFFNPEVYLNLARVYLVFGRRSEALRYLRRGQMIDPGNETIRREMRDLGRRRMPVVPFLPRRHPLNRALGGARTAIQGSLFGRPTA